MRNNTIDQSLNSKSRTKTIFLNSYKHSFLVNWYSKLHVCDKYIPIYSQE